MADGHVRAGDLFAGRYRLTVLLSENRGGRFWRARDEVLGRSVSLTMIDRSDPRAERLMDAARRSAKVVDQRVLRVLDADLTDTECYVVSEWGDGQSLDLILAEQGPLSPRRAAWIAAETADTLARAHQRGEAHGLVNPENVLIDRHGQVRIISFAVGAAMYGRPVGRPADDVFDVAGLLYAGLTGRWAGRSPSRVAPAPQEAGSVLRPRQVRAGVPRLLDQVCDHLINGSVGRLPDPATVRSARGLGDLLERFVGDPSDLVVPDQHSLATITLAAQTPAPLHHTTSRPTHATPDVPAAGLAEGPAARAVEADAAMAPAAGDSAAAAPDDVPTQLGLPALEDTSPDVTEGADPLTDTSWLTKRDDTPPAPPPPPPASRPLFAPEPAPGEPARRSRVDSAELSPVVPEEWRRPLPPPHHEEHVEDEDLAPEPGSRWFKLAVVVSVVALVLLVGVALQQVLGGTKAEPQPDRPRTSASSAPELNALSGLVVSDFDPQSDSGEENPELTPLTVDGNLTTAWETLRYYQNFAPRGYKSGVGLVVDLGESRNVGEVVARVQGGETSASLYLSDEPPTGLPTGAPLGRQTALEKLSWSFPERPSGRYLTLWITSLPAVEGGFRATVSEITVRAEDQ